MAAPTDSQSCPQRAHDLPLIYKLALASLIGLAILLQQRELPDWALLVGTGAAAALLAHGMVLCQWHLRVRLAHQVFLLLAISCLAAGWGAWRSQLILQDGLAPDEDGQVVTLHIEVEDLPQFYDEVRP
ncbi:MAG: hypothetical protein O2848_02700, partial [Proteobacteria bacterium]|nr:hypothetical protein [Pseudomonadota bacterium]